MQEKKLWYTADKRPVYLNNLFHSSSLFMCCSGPSLLQHNLSLLKNLPTFAVNNAPVALRKHGGFSPTFWTMTDDVGNFCASIYEDPRILKFLPDGKVDNKIFDNQAWDREFPSGNAYKNKKVRDCPGVLYYHRPPKEHEFFDPDTFLTGDKFCWGNWACRCACGYVRHEESKDKLCPECGSTNRWGSRSCMLVAMRMAYELGFRKVFLLGCDFTMQNGQQNYAFEQDRAGGAVRNNNNTYRMLNERFDSLVPVFAKEGLQVWNCYKESGLKSFPYLPFMDAIEMTYAYPEEDRTDGLYDRKAREKDWKKQQEAQRHLTGKPETLAEFVEMMTK